MTQTGARSKIERIQFVSDFALRCFLEFSESRIFDGFIHMPHLAAFQFCSVFVLFIVIF